jgi:hypothetical protein
MWRWIIARKLRTIWGKVDQGDWRAATSTGAPEIHFQFVGATPLGADLHTLEAWERWFAGVFERFPGIRFTLEEVLVQGWPWDTRFAARIRIQAPLADGTRYENLAMQWGRLRWGKLVDDLVLEDTLALADALGRQAKAT